MGRSEAAGAAATASGAEQGGPQPSPVEGPASLPLGETGQTAEPPLGDEPGATAPGSPSDDGASEDVWAEQPDPEAAAPVLEWLRSMPLGSGLRAEGGQEPSWPDRN